MAQSFFPITPVDVTPETGWWDIDLSAHIPAGATGAVFHVEGTPGPCGFCLQKKGSTDSRNQPIQDDSNHTWAACGVDANRVIRAYKQGPWAKFWLVAYTMSGVTFHTNGYDKSPAVGSWQDVDCSVEAPGAIGLIFEIICVGTAYNFGIQKKGSTDNRLSKIADHVHFLAIVGCDASQVCQIYRENTWIECYLLGYVTDGAVFNTNATDLSLTSTGAWLDLSALPAGSCMGFIEVHTPAHELGFGLRKNGSSENIYGDTHDSLHAAVECDASQLIEGKIESTVVDFFLQGYAEAPAAAAGAGGNFAQAAAALLT